MLLAGTVSARGTGRLLKFDPSVVRIDTVRYDGGPVKVTFVCTNISDKPVVILDVRSQCGCFTADVPKKSIAPGAKAKVVATFNPHTLFGDQKRHLTVVATNGDYKRFNTITLECYVKQDKSESEILYPVLLAPGLRTDVAVLGFRLRSAGEKPVRNLVLYNDTDAAIALVSSAGSRVCAQVPDEIPARSRIEVPVMLDTKGLPPGDFEEILTLKVKGTDLVKIPLKGRIKGD